MSNQVADAFLGCFVVVMLAVTLVLLVRGRWSRGRRRLVVAASLLPLSQALTASALFHLLVWNECDPAIIVVVLLACVLALGADVLLFRGIDAAVDRRAQQERARVIEEQLEIQKGYFHDLEAERSQAADTRSLLSGELDRVSRAVQAREAQAVSEATRAATMTMAAPGGRYCDHAVVDALLCAKAREFEAAGVSMDWQVEAYEGMGLPDAALCAVFSNVLDNSLHACERVPGPRWSRLRAQVALGAFNVESENPCPPQAGGLRAVKARSATAEHGWGLEILQLVARRFGGEVTTSQEGGVYRTEVFMLAARDA